MARLMEPTAKQQARWKRWVAKRPPVVRALAERFDPWSLYLLKTTGQRVAVLSYFEDGTVMVWVSPHWNLVLFEREVFGINPDDLEPCELPSPDEPVGAMMNQEEVAENQDALRMLVRPDLFARGEDGQVVRKVRPS